MKTLKFLLISIFAVFAIACESGIDPITPVGQEPDKTAPTVTINYPTEGSKLSFYKQEVATINFDFEVSDDIELASISLTLNDEEIGKFDQFKDYRKAFINYAYDKLTNGEYELTVEAVDLSGKKTAKTVNFSKDSSYTPLYGGEIFYMSFEDTFVELISEKEPAKTGTPGFAPGKKGQAYAGASDGYLTFGLSDLPEALGTDFSVGFWYKVNASPDRAGIIVIGPEDNSRIHGFRLFRENAGGKQRIKANVGNGTAEGWVDNENGKADLDPADNAWHYITLTLTKGKATLYVDGEEAATNNLTEISWESCDIMSIGSGAPRFTEWNHLSDESLIDELRLFNKALTPAEIQDVMK